MQYKGYLKPKKKEEVPTLSGSIDSIFKTIQDLNEVKSQVVEALDTKVKEVDIHIESAETILDKKIKDVDQTIQKAEQNAVQMIKDIQNITQLKGKDGEDADPIDEEKIIESILKKLPKPVDEKTLTKKILAKIPDAKSSLKIIQEKFETDPMAIIDKIMALPEEKFKLKTSQIDGLEQTIRAFQSQLGRGYLHGGGIGDAPKDDIVYSRRNGVWVNEIVVSDTPPSNPYINQLWFDIS